MTTTNTATAIPGTELRHAAAEIGARIATHTDAHDRDGTFVEEGFAALRAAGYLASPVPTELGGGGATVDQVAWAQHELARHCSSTALASAMHLHVVLTTAWRHRRNLPGAEGLLRRVANEGLVLASTGGGDFTIPSGDAVAVEGGWQVTGRKQFVSGAPVADVASMWAVTDAGEAIAFGAPLADPAVTIVETWDATGMRGTASHDLALDGYFVKDEQITARRTPGEFAPTLAAIAANALPVIAATYLGVAAGVRDDVVDALKGTARANDPGVRRSIGLIDHHLASGGWALDGSFAQLGTDPDPTEETFRVATLAKRAVIDHARAAGDLAMDVMGGRAYRQGNRVERAWRDLRAGPFHPLDHELTLRVAGDVALGRPVALR